MSGPDSLRIARKTDQAAIDALLRAAFGGPDEADLMVRLRAAGVIETEMVMPWQEGIVAHLALSWLAAPDGWLALAPVSVAPSWQRKGLGLRMLAGVMRLAAINGQTVVVVGKPDFYVRAGFSRARAAGLTSPYPAEFTSIAGPGRDVPEATLIYPDAFGGV
jgi:putative acetyltransferase